MSNQAEAMMQDQIEGAISENESLRGEIDILKLELEQTRAEAILAVNAARSAERERCAKLCEGMHQEDGPHAYAWAIRTEWAADSDGPNTAGKPQPQAVGLGGRLASNLE